MGPNGSGKSTLSYVLAGREGYEVTRRRSYAQRRGSLAMAPDERAAKGVFLAFQYPIEIPGVATMQFLKVALNAQRKARGEPEMSTPDFMRLVREARRQLGISPGHAEAAGQCRLLRRREEARRDPADGGARAAALHPRRDRFRPRHRRAADRRRRRQCAARARARDDRHHPLPAAARIHRARHACTCCRKGRIVRSGDKSLALELEEHGYADYGKDAA